MGIKMDSVLTNIPHSNPNSIIKIALDKELYFPGETVTGEVWIEPMIDIYFTHIVISLIINEYWKYLKSKDQSVMNSNEICLYKQNIVQKDNLGNAQVYLPQVSLVMNANTRYQYPFSFTLNKNLIPSFEHPLWNTTAYARYKLTADLFSQTVYPQGFTDIIIKSRAKVLNEPLNYASCMNVYTWGIIEYGTTIMSVSYPTNNYRYNDTIIVQVAINNSRCQLDTHSIEINLIREITLFQKNKEKKEVATNVIQKKVYPFVCAHHQKMTQNLTIQLRDSNKMFQDNYPVYPVLGDNKELLLSDIQSLLIECKYRLEVDCFFDSFVGYASRPRVTMPLSVTYQTIADLEIENSIIMKEEEEIKKALYESKIEFQNKIIQEQEIIHEQMKIITNQMNISPNAKVDNPINNNYNDYPMMEKDSNDDKSNSQSNNKQTKEHSTNDQPIIDINAL